MSFAATFVWALRVKGKTVNRNGIIQTIRMGDFTSQKKGNDSKVANISLRDSLKKRETIFFLAGITSS